MTQSTPTPDLLPTVAHNVLRVLDGNDPDHIANALSDYAWAHVQEETGFSKESARFSCSYYPNLRGMDSVVSSARKAIATATAHSARLAAMPRKKLRAELERVAQPMERAA